MRIAICMPKPLFVKSASENFFYALARELEKRNHEVDLITIPLISNPPLKILDSVLSWNLLDLEKFNGKDIDLVISTNFPSYTVNHSNHVTVLFHQYRQAYDLKNTEFDDLKNDQTGKFVRKKIIEIDNKSLKKVKKIITSHSSVSKRLMDNNQISSDCLDLPEEIYDEFEFTKRTGEKPIKNLDDLKLNWDSIIEKVLN